MRSEEIAEQNEILNQLRQSIRLPRTLFARTFGAPVRLFTPDSTLSDTFLLFPII